MLERWAGGIYCGRCREQCHSDTRDTSITIDATRLGRDVGAKRKAAVVLSEPYLQII